VPCLGTPERLREGSIHLEKWFKNATLHNVKTIYFIYHKVLLQISESHRVSCFKQTLKHSPARLGHRAEHSRRDPVAGFSASSWATSDWQYQDTLSFWFIYPSFYSKAYDRVSATDGQGGRQTHGTDKQETIFNYRWIHTQRDKQVDKQADGHRFKSDRTIDGRIYIWITDG